MTQEAKFLALEMNWKTSVNMCIIALENGNAEARKIAREELMRLADGMDQIIEKEKAAKSCESACADYGDA